MKRNSKEKWIHQIILFMALITLACGITFTGVNDTSEGDLMATQVALGATQTALAAGQLPQGETTDDMAPRVSYNGVSLIPPSGWTMSTQTVPADAAMEAFWSVPQHDCFEVASYPVNNDYHPPQIKIFSVDAFGEINESAQERVVELKTLLAHRPAVPVGAIPFLPIFNAAQMVQVKVAFLDFQNGSGVRFLTQFGQAFWPLNNRGMVYAYIGLTHDGQYLVSALLPIAHPALEPYTDFQPPADFYDAAEQFLSDQVGVLKAQPDESFTPALGDLDAMIKSLSVEK